MACQIYSDYSVTNMQKFVITKEGELRFGDVRLHKDLLPWGDDECFGGGFWKVEACSISLYGRSFDFGAPDFSHVRKIDWTGIGGKPTSLLYYPNYPDLDNAEHVFANP